MRKCPCLISNSKIPLTLPYNFIKVHHNPSILFRYFFSLSLTMKGQDAVSYCAVVLVALLVISTGSAGWQFSSPTP